MRWLLASVLATGGYFLLPSASAQNVFYDLIGLCTVAAIGIGVHMHHPIHPAHWYVLAFGLLILAVGDVVFAYYENVLRIKDPFPSIADVFYLTGMPCLAVGLLLIQRRSVPGRQWANLIDALIIATVAGMILWIFLMEPHIKVKPVRCSNA